MLRPIYPNEIITSPLIPNESDSKENVEKVVNPPQNPTTNNALSLFENTPLRESHPKIIPNMKQPKIFIIKVAKGKGAL